MIVWLAFTFRGRAVLVSILDSTSRIGTNTAKHALNVWSGGQTFKEVSKIDALMRSGRQKAQMLSGAAEGHPAKIEFYGQWMLPVLETTMSSLSMRQDLHRCIQGHLYSRRD